MQHIAAEYEPRGCCNLNLRGLPCLDLSYFAARNAETIEFAELKQSIKMEHHVLRCDLTFRFHATQLVSVAPRFKICPPRHLAHMGEIAAPTPERRPV